MLDICFFESWRLLLKLGRSIYRPRDKKIAIFYQKYISYKFQLSFFFNFFGLQNPGYGTGTGSAFLWNKILDPTRIATNVDPQHWLCLFGSKARYGSVVGQHVTLYPVNEEKKFYSILGLVSVWDHEGNGRRRNGSTTLKQTLLYS